MPCSAKQAFHQRLHEWYARAGRKDLPWRNTTDAYAIYLSEIMLQQTQVSTVLQRFYAPFLQRFPTLHALAHATQDEVLQAWQGLGYYNRAINLHKTAKECRESLPRHVEELMALPGIGRNTAHAVAAFAYRQPVAVMEANVRRVLCRIFALSDPTENDLWEKAAELLDGDSPFDYNQAMMDVGAMLCKKRAPECGQCPAQPLCKGENSPERYPEPKRTKATPVRKKQIVVFCNPKGQYYAIPRTSRFLNGLYQFVEIENDVLHLTLGKTSYDLLNAVRIGHVRQQYSHFTLEAEIFLQHADTGGGKDWYNILHLEKLPVSMAEKKIIALLNDHKKSN